LCARVSPKVWNTVGAMDAYLELATTVFQTFGDTLAHHAAMPIEFDGDMQYRRSTSEPPQLLPAEPGLRYWLRPKGRPAKTTELDNSVALTLNRGIDMNDDTYRDALYAWFERYAADNPELQGFLHFSLHGGHFGILSRRTATQ